MIALLFWISAAAIIYTYAGYPAIIWLIGRLRPRPVNKSNVTLSVSIVLACHNEAARVEARIRNLLECHYPAELIEVIVVSDGSADCTADIARRCETNRVKVLEYDSRRGKAAALNLGVSSAGGEIIVFADARQRFEAGAIRELVTNFADESVGAVTGELVLEDPRVGIEGVGLYWRYEKLIRRSEGRTGSVIGATGAIYAIRRRLWKPLPPGTILDDVYTPMQIALAGHRVVFEEKARAHDRLATARLREFSRKVRTLAGNYQLCQIMPRILVPDRWLIFQFYSHKLIRLIAPVFLLLLLGSNACLVFREPPGFALLFFQTHLALQLVFYASVAAAAFLPSGDRRPKLLSLSYTFSMMNLAAIVGLIFFLSGKRDLWDRAEG